MRSVIKAFLARFSGKATPGFRDQSQEKPASWYDDDYRSNVEYERHYCETRYYPLWCIIVDRIITSGAGRVLEVGCGTGQLAEFLYDSGIYDYIGFDFSEVAIARARQRVPAFPFVVDDATTTSLYTDFAPNVIICTEVLEHITNDLLIVQRFPNGSRCLCSVPNFPYRSHVRHFDSVDQVMQRYGPFLTNSR